jgi:mannose-6-phosphate isomerase-like protein (cupin superfamily)
MKPKKIDKDWGHELWLANNHEHDYCGKILHIDAGHGSSMHFHMNKHETFYILKGQLELELLDTRDGTKSIVILDEGDGYEIEQGQPHKLVAGIDTDIVEISTFHRDEDSYRVWR